MTHPRLPWRRESKNFAYREPRRLLDRARLWPRLHLDLPSRVLGYALLASLRIGGKSNATPIAVSDAVGIVACLSVRSGFDALLAALRLPAGSEVVLSALTHPDMARIVSEHELVPVPADIDEECLAPSAEEIARRLTPQTRVVVVAHLFGTRVRLGEIANITRKEGLLLVEDSAQSFEGIDAVPGEHADVSLFSFGPMKASSAMGGGLIHIHDQRLRTEVARVIATYPEQPRAEFVGRTGRFALIMLVSNPRLYYWFVRAVEWRGRDVDDVVLSLVRSFQVDLMRRIRRRPSAALRAVMGYRLARFDVARFAARTRLAEHVSRELSEWVRCPGRQADGTPNWVFPVLTKNPHALRRALRAEGFDSSGVTTGMAVVEGESDVGRARPLKASRILDEITFIPLYPELPTASVDRLVLAIRTAAQDEAL